MCGTGLPRCLCAAARSPREKVKMRAAGGIQTVGLPSPQPPPRGEGVRSGPGTTTVYTVYIDAYRITCHYFTTCPILEDTWGYQGGMQCQSLRRCRASALFQTAMLYSRV